MIRRDDAGIRKARQDADLPRQATPRGYRSTRAADAETPLALRAVPQQPEGRDVAGSMERRPT